MVGATARDVIVKHTSVKSLLMIQESDTSWNLHMPDLQMIYDVLI